MFTAAGGISGLFSALVAAFGNVEATIAAIGESDPAGSPVATADAAGGAVAFPRGLWLLTAGLYLVSAACYLVKRGVRKKMSGILGLLVLAACFSAVYDLYTCEARRKKRTASTGDERR
jgi:hypothetical protein